MTSKSITLKGWKYYFDDTEGGNYYNGGGGGGGGKINFNDRCLKNFKQKTVCSFIKFADVVSS
jgi:hypothetical protein